MSGSGGQTKAAEDCRTPRRSRVNRTGPAMPKVLECGRPLPLSLAPHAPSRWLLLGRSRIGRRGSGGSAGRAPDAVPGQDRDDVRMGAAIFPQLADKFIHRRAGDLFILGNEGRVLGAETIEFAVNVLE